MRRTLQAESAATQPLALVACSGGADSLALAAGAAQAARSARWRIGAVVVDHQLQPDSDAVAAAAADQCRTLGLDPVVVVAVRVGTRGGPEAAARSARYAAFASTALSCGAAAVMLAHSLDDQAETVLLGLARGSGARSLAGMPGRAELPGAAETVILRPLLGLTRQDLAAACRQWGLHPWQDPHNEDPGYARVRIRRTVLPSLAQALGPGVPQALARTAALLRDDDEALSDQAEQVLDSTADRAASPVAVDCAALAVHHSAIRRRVLQLLIVEAGAPAARVTAAHLLRLDALVLAGARSSAPAGPLALPGGVAAALACGRLELLRRQE